MSLIVAREEKNKIFIVSDTKLTYPEEDREISQRQKTNPKDGVIKVVVIRATLCICFAGNEDYANEAIKKIDDNDTIDEILETLKEYHFESRFSTDFIVCSGESKPKFIEIKNGSITTTSSSWIGSKRAFNQFQEEMLSENKIVSNGISIQSGDNTLHKMGKAMDQVIQNEQFPEVSGFKVTVVFDGEKFKYTGYLSSYSGYRKISVNMPGNVNSFVIPLGHATASEGGYTINFFESYVNTDHVGLHLKQGNFGVVYSKGDGGLLYPNIAKNMDELDFADYVKDKFNIFPMGLTQDAHVKYGTMGNVHFEKKEYEQALIWYNKGINHVNGKQKAEFYFYKAVCLVKLKNLQEAVMSFQEAINIDFSYQVSATSIMKNAFNYR